MLLTVQSNPDHEALLGTKIVKTIVTAVINLNSTNSWREDSESGGPRSRSNSESGSSARLGGMNNSNSQIDTTPKPPMISNLDQILRTFYQMADFESAIGLTKEKEISS